MIVIPKRFKHCSFENYKVNPKNKDAFEALERYSKNLESNYESGKCFILSGDVGVGKTHLSYAFARVVDEKWTLKLSDFEKEGLEKGWISKSNRNKIVVTTLVDILKSIKSTFNRNKDYHLNLHGKSADCDWLIIDEVGVQFDTDAERTMLYDIFSYRYDCMRPTILLSNLDKDGIFKKLGKRIGDRIFGGAEYFYINDNSRR